MPQKDNRKNSTELTTCPGKIKVPSEQEVIVLSRMRKLRVKAKALKEKLASLTIASDGNETSAKARMVALEHERP